MALDTPGRGGQECIARRFSAGLGFSSRSVGDEITCTYMIVRF